MERPRQVVWNPRDARVAPHGPRKMETRINTRSAQPFSAHRDDRSGPRSQTWTPTGLGCMRKQVSERRSQVSGKACRFSELLAWHLDSHKSSNIAAKLSIRSPHVSRSEDQHSRWLHELRPPTCSLIGRRNTGSSLPRASNIPVSPTGLPRLTGTGPR
jgi:hypothetical protein